MIPRSVSSAAVIAITFSLSFLSPIVRPAASAPELAPEAAGKVAQAHRANPQAPRMDGSLEDAAWREAPAFSDFVQDEPNEGTPPTQRTEVRMLYDDEALYVGVEAWDTEPAKIASRLTRRDAESSSDCIWVVLDSHHDHQTGYTFGLNPLGVKRDFLFYQDTQEDDSWDAVWDGAARVHSGGWSAEFRIPFSQLRFSPAEEQSWGFNVLREIQRNNEQDMWVWVPRAASGFVSHCGHLEGLRGIRPGRRLEMMPYVTSRGTFQAEGDVLHPNGRAYDLFTGMDLKYGLGSGITLDATVNPDFGQVEADPSVLNLTEFETFFPEKRPFFIEGAKFFETPIQLFFSRRIGRAPGAYGIPSTDEELFRPGNTTILGAAKLTGKTSAGTSFGLLEAATDEEFATTDEIQRDESGAEIGRVRRERLIEPRTNFLVGRIQQDVLAGNSTVGGILTARHREGELPDLSGGADWNLNFSQNKWNLHGQLAAAASGPAGSRESGPAATVEFCKNTGKWTRWEVGGDYFSSQFQINPMGYLRQNDRRRMWAWYQVGTRDPYHFLRRSGHNFNYWRAENHDGYRVEDGGNYNNWFTFMNYWGAGFSLEFARGRYSDTTTRGGPPVYIDPYRNFYCWVQSDDRKRLVWYQDFWAGKSLAPGIWWRGAESTLQFRPSTAVSCELGTSLEESHDFWQWVDKVTDASGQTHYVFADLHTQVLDVTFRSDVTFSRNLSLQLYLQPFIAVGHYMNPVELANPPDNDLRPYDYELHDFSAKSLNSNLVLRWEYRPGSTLYLVWNRAAEDYAHPGNFRAGRDLADLFGAPGTDVLFLKVSFWLNP